MQSSPVSDSPSSESSSDSTLSLSSASSMSNSCSSPVHPASLVDPSSHSPALLQLVNVKLSRPVIEYIVDCVSETVDYALGRSSSQKPTRGRAQSPYLAKFALFVSTTISRAEVATPTILTALVYIARARPHLSIAIEEWALERVFLGALIAASKYTQDSTLKNVHWALCTGVFGKNDVGRIEREFFEVLDWELGVSEADLMAHHAGLVAVSGSGTLHVAVPRQRVHARRPSVPVPELEASSRSSSSSDSPQSTAVSLSPRTPASAPHLPAPEPSKDADVDIDGEASFILHPTLQHTLHKNAGARFHSLLRSFCPHKHEHAHGSHRVHVAS